MLSVNQILKIASEKIISFGFHDASLEVSKLNTRYGLGKIILALESVGVDTSSCFCLFGPDGGISRNTSRWEAGFSYGCYLKWPGPDEGVKVTFPQIKPNACGVLVAKVKNQVSYKDLCIRLNEAKNQSTDISGYKLNLGVSNHFIEMATVTSSKIDALTKGDIAIFIHTSPSERKNQLYDLSYWKLKGGKWIDTALGPIFALWNEQAQEYYDLYREIEEFGKLKRETIARFLFGDIEIICNPTHQGLENINIARLGLYNSLDSSTSPTGLPLFPLTLRWDLPLFLVKGLPNIAPSEIRNNNSLSPDSLGKIYEQIQTVNILPHGSGYQIPFSPKGWDIEHDSGRRLFKLSSNGINYIFTKPSELPYYYRGTEIIEKIMKFRFGEPVAELKQLYTLRY